MRLLRVLYVTGEYPPMAGGIADYTYLMRGALEDENVKGLVLSERGANSDLIVDRWSWSIVPTIRKIVKDRAIDVLHIQYQAGAFDMHPAINMLPALLSLVPVVTTFHDLRPPYLFPKAGGLRYVIMRRMARWSDAVVVTNPADAATLRASRVVVREIPLGPSLPRPDRDSIPNTSIGYFGFPSHQKGFNILLEAAARINENRRPSITVVGGSPPQPGSHGFLSRHEVERTAAELGIHVNWTGYLLPQDASNALAECCVIALPFPAGATLRSSALIGAIQTGRPVITTAPRTSDGLGEIDRLSQLIVVAPGDTTALRDAIERSMNWAGKAEPLPDAFRWSSIASRHRALYDTVLKGRSV